MLNLPTMTSKRAVYVGETKCAHCPKKECAYLTERWREARERASTRELQEGATEFRQGKRNGIGV